MSLSSGVGSAFSRAVDSFGRFDSLALNRCTFRSFSQAGAGATSPHAAPLRTRFLLPFLQCFLQHGQPASLDRSISASRAFHSRLLLHHLPSDLEGCLVRGGWKDCSNSRLARARSIISTSQPRREATAVRKCGGLVPGLLLSRSDGVIRV